MAKVYQTNILKEALLNYKNTDIIAFPTDTVYGIGANLFSIEAINKIYQTKHRPGHKPLAVLCANKQQILQVVKEIPPQMELLINHFMPGALTVILPKKEEVPDFVTSNLPTIGVRIPNHKIALEILEKVGPLATTSANLSGNKSLNDASDVIKRLGDNIDIIIDGGKTDIQIPSTVVTILNDEIKIIREGSIEKEMIQQVLNK
ncbi:threonylcarbamoyl-AMP synthase [Mycoplasmatota bacterium]|nr:threonylcarbamoyl-AMP synthase [Mycoplasmatota bacterium]